MHFSPGPHHPITLRREGQALTQLDEDTCIQIRWAFGARIALRHLVNTVVALQAII